MPEESTDHSSYDYDVAVCGYGPAGQAVTSLLARLGHRVIAFEKHPALYGLPRLCTINGEPVRIAAVAGDLQHILRESSPVNFFEFRSGDGELLAKLEWTAPHPSGHPMRTSMYQPNLEDAMYEAALEHGATVRLGWPVIELNQDERQVMLVACPREHGALRPNRAETFHVKYVVGADGAHSFVRETVGIEREDFGYQEAFLSLDVKRKHDLDGRFRNVAAICDPGRTIASIPIGENRIRFEFLVNPDDDHSELMTRDRGYEMLHDAYGLSEDDVDLYRQVIFPFEGQLATRWRIGRAFILGDAAHLMPPFLGEGAGSALRDAINLSWKLDLVLRGICEDQLLDTYTLERRPHVREHVLGSIALAELACDRNPETALARNQAYREGRIPPPPEEPTLTAGILHRVSGDELEPPTGALAFQDVVEYQGREGRFDDVVGWGFSLLTRETDPSKVLNAEQEALLRQIGCRSVAIVQEPRAGAVFDVKGTYQRYFESLGIVGVLVRPDFNAFGGVRSLAELPALVDDLKRQLGVRAAAPPATVQVRS